MKKYKHNANMKKIICWLKGHKRGKSFCSQNYNGIRNFNNYVWTIKCSRCGYKIEYLSPRARLVGTEIRFGFDGI
jgi:hypothetical protein